MKSVSVASILQNEYKHLPFEGLVKAVIGTPAPNAQMMIYGSPGSQKSTFILALCAYLQHFGRVCYKALEEGDSLTFQKKVKRIGNVFDPKQVILEDEMASKKGEFDAYSFVVIDSATVIGVEAQHIAAMKKAYPSTMFIYVYQCTKDGKFRGSNEIEHEVDIALKAEKGVIKQQKNRCGGVEDCTVQEMIDFAQVKSKPISGFLGNVGKIEDEGDVPGLSRVDTYWRKNKPQSLFDFDNPKIHRGTDIDAKYKYLFGESEKDGFADIEEAAKTLRSDFGIQGFEFGKWTTEEDRINYLKATTITLSDLAYLLGFKKIGLSKLSICFGSRGVPNASGHFQPNELYINLTRYDRDNSFKSLEGMARKEAYIKAIASRGLPSLVHEFGHFVDCMAANAQGVKGLASGDYRASFLQNGYSVGEFGAKIDEIILLACGKKGNVTPYGARLIAQDVQKDNDGNDVVVPYFQLRAEVFARIFEKWAAVKLKQNGFFNIFFTKLKHNTDDVAGNVYLTNKEFEGIQPLMDSFMTKYSNAVKGNERVVSIKKKAETKVEVTPQPKPEGAAQSTKKTEQKKVTQTQSQDAPDLDKVYRLPLNAINTDTKRFQNRDTEFSQQSVDKIVANFDANKLDPIVVWKDPNNGKTYVLSGHSRFEAHKQLKKPTIPARYFQGTEAEAKEYSRVHANRAATSEGLMADIRAFKYQRDELKRTKTDLQKDWGNYHKLEAYSYLNPKGKFLENLESKASGSFKYLEMRAQWVGNLRKMYPLLTNLHENEMFEYLYFDKKGSEIDKDIFINAVQTQATRLDFDPNKPLKLGKKTGTDARADTSEAQARLREIDLELKDYAAKRRVANTQEEKEAIDKFLKRLNEEKLLIEKNIGLVLKTQNSLFGVQNLQRKYFKQLQKYSKEWANTPKPIKTDLLRKIQHAEDYAGIFAGDYIKFRDADGSISYGHVEYESFSSKDGRYFSCYGSEKPIFYHDIIAKMTKEQYKKKTLGSVKSTLLDKYGLSQDEAEMLYFLRSTKLGAKYAKSNYPNYFTFWSLVINKKMIENAEGGGYKISERGRKFINDVDNQNKKNEFLEKNPTLFGVKGEKTQLTPFIAIAKRLVGELGKKQHCETENVLPYNVAMSISKTIKEYPNLEKKIVDSLKKAYKKDNKITKQSWDNIKNNGLNLALFGVK